MSGNLPAVPDDGDVVEGTIVEDEPAPAAPPKVYVLQPVVQRITVVVQHPVPRAAGRHVLYVPAGLVVIARRWARRRQLASAMAERSEMAGDRTAALALLKQAEDERKGRAERRKQLAEMTVALLQVSPYAIGLWVLAMIFTGLALAWAHHSAAYLLWPWRTLADFISDLVAAFMILIWVVAIGVPLGFISWLHHLGRTGELAPKWAATSADGDVDMAIDEAAVTLALKQLRIPQILDHVKTGQPLPYIVPCRTEGRGTYCEIRLPGGLPAVEIAKQGRRERLAAGLHRLTKEVWPSVGADNSHLKLWVADKGALNEGAGPYPLLTEGVTDVFKGVPFGKTLRGDPVTAPLMERNTITGGMPGQGKSSAARALMVGAALDPTAELWIMIPDVNFDFEVMKRRCTRYVMGAEDEKVEAIRDWLADLHDEVQVRGQRLVDHEVPAVTRRLASAGVGLHPVFVLLEEAHVAIQHETYGKEISKLLVDIVKLGRKRGIHVIVSTQAPTKDSMPRDVTRNCSNGIAFAVGDHVPNDALLGAGAYRAGHRATELIPGTDIGVAVVKGFSGERSEMVQVYFLDVERGHDQVTPIIDRAMAALEKRGGLPGGGAPQLALEVRDLLDDLAEVMEGDEKVSLADLCHRLRRLAPKWGAYRSLNSTELGRLLDAQGVRTTRPKNVPTLDPADLAEAAAGRGE